jgi:hypothetical protein
MKEQLGLEELEMDEEMEGEELGIEELEEGMLS